MEKVNVALAGLGFGRSFVPIYADHPQVGMVGIYDPDQRKTAQAAGQFGINKMYNSFEEVLDDPEVDAVHLVSPIPAHADQTVRVLESGKHCACTVPMATSLEDLRRITDAVRKSGKRYMMMETTLYTYQFFYVRQMLERGVLGRIQFLRGSHYQDMAQWPGYWMGLPPMWYGTHAIGPMVALSGSRIRKVCCFGSGTMEPWLRTQYGNPFPVETAIFAFENGLKGEATRSLFETARAYQEGLFVYGSKATFEWGLRDSDEPFITTTIPADENGRGGRTETRAVALPNFHHSLPASIQKYTVSTADFDPLDPQKSLAKGMGGGHHGSHPHLVHEFVTSILEDRKPWIDEVMGGNITGAGICAHLSAMQDGAGVEVPVF